MKEGRSVNSAFSSTLKYYREKRGYSLRQLKELTGISESYLNRLENFSRKAPSIPIVSRISNALNIPLTTLLDISTEDIPISKIQSVTDLLLFNDLKIEEDKVMNESAKELFIQIIEFVINASWESETKITEMCTLAEIINDFKEELKVS